jgi:hypothetical protein
MEGYMSERKVIHEVKLQKSVVIILGALAFGVCANVFAPAFTIKDAVAELGYGDKLKIEHSGYISVR